MTTNGNDKRNFRSYYYEKVGFRGVEEKKSLEILLKEQPIDVVKLKHFCLRFPVAGVHRNFLWKILLGIYIYISLNNVPRRVLRFEIFVTARTVDFSRCIAFLYREPLVGVESETNAVQWLGSCLRRHGSHCHRRFDSRETSARLAARQQAAPLWLSISSKRFRWSAVR